MFAPNKPPSLKKKYKLASSPPDATYVIYQDITYLKNLKLIISVFKNSYNGMFEPNNKSPSVIKRKINSHRRLTMPPMSYTKIWIILKILNQSFSLILN